ncbi:hypothetical protein BGK55_04010 [Xanthomonas citri pv. malvacearum]|uniref:Uncharacterized protein n=1 Tax=Xanthomonas campestris pv. malvacearum TaxID=86040 RepID=A0AA44Z2Z7_XANCM|nr:hypothetical protein BGK55_04010 [Xanthomonas citri pv. malvacearum]NMI12879.1 hypothetical protein [Xanthomonas citri]OOW62769.1 hypothetical protein Xths_14425 [Xanthomonas campestris pv. thespesiae]OOW77502.1 hypothetical protein Xlen_17490 [Xanthomonas campestris pv. leeana]ASN10883.1 hypothetical protein APY30_18130 [Xanthomonas citri pv. malvacearum]
MLEVQPTLDRHFDRGIDRHLGFYMSSHMRRVTRTALHGEKMMAGLQRWRGRAGHYVVYTREAVCHCLGRQTCGRPITAFIW